MAGSAQSSVEWHNDMEIFGSLEAAKSPSRQHRQAVVTHYNV